MVKIDPGHHLAVRGKKAPFDLEAKFLDSLERIEGLADKDLRGSNCRLRLFRTGNVVEKALPDPGPAFLVFDTGIDRNELGPPAEVTPSFMEYFFHDIPFRLSLRKVYHAEMAKQDGAGGLEKTFPRDLPVAD